jgi:hypothetical protein
MAALSMGGSDMHKVSEDVNGAWTERAGASVYWRETYSGGERLRLAVPANVRSVMRALSDRLPAPHQLLYVLHTPRGEGEAGRYQSEMLPDGELRTLLSRFEDFLWADGRHDLWLRSAESGALIVWDRHNDVYCYGDLDRFEAELVQLGFEPGDPPPLGTHLHHYRVEFDGDAAALLAAQIWSRTPLRPEDEQGGL